MKKSLWFILGLSLVMFTKLSWSASGDQKVQLNSVNELATVTVTVIKTPVDVDIRDLSSTSDSVSAVQKGTWTVIIGGTPTMRSLDQSIDSIKVYGDKGIAIKQDSTGQIYAVTAPEIGNNIRKTFVFSNVAAGVWTEIGSYTVTAGKNLKIYNVHATGRYATDYKISDGTVSQDIYLATSPADGNDEVNVERPVPIVAGTIVRVSIKPDDVVNSGTISFSGFEY